LGLYLLPHISGEKKGASNTFLDKNETNKPIGIYVLKELFLNAWLNTYFKNNSVSFKKI